MKRFNKRKDFKHKWMTNDLLTLINKENDRYRDWKSTTHNIQYETNNFFLTFEKIVNNEITAAKSLYYFNTFTAQKMI